MPPPAPSPPRGGCAAAARSALGGEVAEAGENRAAATEDAGDAAEHSRPGSATAALTAGASDCGIRLEGRRRQRECARGEVDRATRTRTARTPGTARPARQARYRCAVSFSSTAARTTRAAGPANGLVRGKGIIRENQMAARGVKSPSRAPTASSP